MIRTLVELQWMSLRGRVVRWARLLKQPRYLVGAVVGAAWMFFWVGRRVMQSGMHVRLGHAAAFEGIAREAIPSIHLLAAIVITFLLALPWLFPMGRLGLGLREAELTMLLQAPLTRRQVIGYGLLKSFLGILFSAFFFALILGLGGPLDRLRTFLAFVLLFLPWDLSSKGCALFLLRQREVRPALAWTRRFVLTLALLSYLAVVVALVIRFQQDVFAGLRGFDSEHLAQRLAEVPRPLLLHWLVLPGRVLTGPLFAEGWRGFATAALPLLALIIAQRELVVRSGAHFEESALEHAKEEETKASPTRRFKKLSTRARARAPFLLRSSGRPEVAIAWKNLMRVTRLPLDRILLGGMTLIAVIAALPVLFRWAEIPYFVMLLIGLIAFALPTILVGMAWKNDIRTELGHLELLRTWPVSPERFVLAQVAAPALLSVLTATLGGILVLAAWSGSRLLELRTGADSQLTVLPNGALGAPEGVGLALLLVGLLPLSACGAFASSAMQNLAVLFVPAWMAESSVGSKGVAAFGQRLVLGTGVLLAFVIALIPGVVLVGLAILLQRLLGIPWSAWAFPLWGVLAATPLLAIGWLAVRLAAKLWRDLDPSEEVLAIGS